MNTDKSVNILDKDYIQWIKDLSNRYHRSQIKAAVKVNREMLRFYWELGKDIVTLKAKSRWGSRFMKNLSRDLKNLNPKATCFSGINLLYMKNFYLLYQSFVGITPQIGEQNNGSTNTPQFEEQITQQVVEIINQDYFLHLGDLCLSNGSERMEKEYVTQLP